MGKPWDCLRKVVEPKQPPIEPGDWKAHAGDGRAAATVEISSIGTRATLNIDWQAFSPTGLRELAEFCNELADQLEGK